MNEMTWKRVRGLRALVFDMVEHGSRVVERVQKETADRPFSILEKIPGIEEPARGIHVVYDVSVSTTHQAVRLVSRVVGKGVELGIDIAEDIAGHTP